MSSAKPGHRPITLLELRRGVAVTPRGVELGIDQIPGVVVADVQVHDPMAAAWMPAGHAVVRVWGGEGPRVWRVIQASPLFRGLTVALVVLPVTRWARARAWCRWQVHRLRRWAE